MVIDKFGRSLSTKKQTLGFVLTESGDFDIKQKRILNLHKPLDLNDAANKFYVDEKIRQNLNLIKNEMRQKLLQSFNAIKKLEKQVNELSVSLKTLEKEFNGLDVKFSKEKLDTSIIIALPQEQKPHSSVNSKQFSNENTGSTTSTVASAPKKMRIE